MTTPANLPQDKERFASSVIRALENDPDLRQSTANIRALVFRASLLMEQTGRSKEALTDAECAIDLLLRRASVETTTTDTTTTTTTGSSGSLLMAQAYRVLADVQELAENYPAAMEALQLMAVSQPAMRTKVVQELARMRQRAAAAAAAATV